MKLIKLISVLGTLWCLSLNANAEGGCPSGMQPYQPGSNQSWSCMPIPGYSGGGASRGGAPEWQSFSDPAPVWQDRWGAMATDEPRGILGAVTEYPSEQAAQLAALSDCKAKGGINCTLANSYKNGCTALTASDSTFYVGADTTTDIVVSQGMRACIEGGKKNCRTHYTACSPPVRIR